MLTTNEYELTGIRIFCVFRDKRSGSKRGAGVLPGSGPSRSWSDYWRGLGFALYRSKNDDL